MHIKNVIFDFGGVLVDWDPRHMYKTVFDDQSEMEEFLTEVCTNEWNLEQDRGRPLDEATRILVEMYPEKKELIEMFYDRWEEMLNGCISENVDILEELKFKSNYPLYGLTNWSAETWPTALRLFPFFENFDGILVSGIEKMAKPDPVIFERFLKKFNLKARECLFIDDNKNNIETANSMGFITVHYTKGTNLRNELKKYNIL